MVVNEWVLGQDFLQRLYVLLAGEEFKVCLKILTVK